MFLHFTLHSIHARKVSDHAGDPFNRRVELYQTWSLAELDPIVPGRPECARWARLGFSVRGAPDDGASFGEGDRRRVVDPQIALGVDESLADGKTMHYRFDTHYWESDSSTDKVRAIFSDRTLSYLTSAWRKAREDEEAAREDLEDWLEGNWREILTKAISSAGPIGSGVATAMDLLPVIDLLVKYIGANGDDYHQMHRFVVSLRRKGDTYDWRITDPAGVASEWKTGPGRHDVDVHVTDASGSNAYDARWVFRMID